MQTDIGIQPAKRQTWRHRDYRSLLKEIMDENPNIPDSILRIKYKSVAREDEDYFDAICDYAFDAAFRALHRNYDGHPSPKKTQDKNNERDLAVNSIKEQIILLNQEMPNGKRARYCTLDYLYRLGGVYRTVGKRGSSKLVGEIYSEQDYRKKLGGLT